MTNVERVYEFLEAAGTYYLATVEGDQPRVRAFGTQLLYEGKLYIQTGKIKPVSKQIKANPKVELCAFKDGQWLRLSGVLEEDERREVKKAMLDKMPELRAMYNEDDGNTEMLYFKSGEATFSSFVAPSEKVII